MSLLEARLTVSYSTGLEVLRDVRLSIESGELVGLAGQSGSGKSTLALALLGLHDTRTTKVQGSICFRGRELTRLKEREWRSVRGRDIAFVCQSAISALTPTMRIGDQIREAWEVHSPDRKQWKSEAQRALGSVGLPADDCFLRLFPHQLSVGMAQRFLIAMAVLHRPALLVADEPTSALDAINQSDILDLLRQLNASHGTAILLITHDLLAASRFCHRIAVLHQGGIVEEAEAHGILQNPGTEYTKRLAEAVARWS